MRNTRVQRSQCLDPQSDGLLHMEAVAGLTEDDGGGAVNDLSGLLLECVKYIQRTKYLQ